MSTDPLSSPPAEHDQEVDLVVVGLGPGGESLASGAASAGLDVLAVDRHLVGGECPYYGCIPSKMMLRAADALAEARRAGTLSGRVEVEPSWTPVATRVRDEATADWDDTIAVERLERAGATVVHATARLAGERTVRLTSPSGEERVVRARRGVVLNPGTRPAVPDVPGLAGTPFWTNREAVRASAVPPRLVVVGGGPVGVELAQVFARFGARVVLLQRGDRLLPNDEPEAAAVLADVLTGGVGDGVGDGVDVRTGRSLASVMHGPGEAGTVFSLTLDDGSVLEAEQLLLAAGRTPNLDDLGLPSVGLDAGSRTLEVDEHCRVRGVPGLWAVGDVTGRGAFTHVSMYQSGIALADVLEQDHEPARYHAVPHVTFTDPEVAGVGLTEAAARAVGLRVRTGSTAMEASSRGFTHGPGARGLVKVVEDAERGVLVGACVVGPAGGEVLGLLALAVHAEVPVATLRSMILAYPTFHRAVGSALDDLS
ncbi:NAD(P)/FAD-dependent oxidoreductase [Nocardioides sp. GY 10127]|uniref:dihydrolipoyl dehydrogenase family protein n=1 Tax=Nocardioides sp. GY 10127 TaxID=2569762 RepID=UPI0010A82A19|nr:NAD(P)/FAD-dependent oxidoreductase [Nocardioides sp. GY 10127]TIC85483.1 NAD(P)/FAD-dependent oxidoreductase [Nocardioides sp. GY 10127]